MGRKKGNNKGKKSGKGNQKQTKKSKTKTCSVCFSDLSQSAYTPQEWCKKSMECVCKSCESKKKEEKTMEKEVKIEEKKEEQKEEVKEMEFEIGELPKQFQPRKERSEEEKKLDEVRSKQTPDPTIPVRKLFKEVGLPVNEIVELKDLPVTDYTTKLSKDTEFFNEKKAAEEKLSKKIDCFREGAEVHRQVRQWAMKVAKPGMKFTDLCQGIEDRVHRLMNCHGLQGGFAFPIGCSTNHQAAHWSPNPGDVTTIKKDDVVKIDIGIHVKGYIIDSAFTLTWNDMFDPLLEAVREATNTGVKECGIDVRLCDIGERIQEVMESHEVEINGELKGVKAIDNLNGHSLDKYVIHSGISVPITKGGPTTKLEEGDVLAIETFGSTGNGHVNDVGECSHFMKMKDVSQYAVKGLRLKSSRKLLNTIEQQYKTMCFCPRWLEKPEIFGKNYKAGLRSLVNNDIVKEYPPLCDIKGSYVAQYEHTLMLRPTCKEVFSRGTDF